MIFTNKILNAYLKLSGSVTLSDNEVCTILTSSDTDAKTTLNKIASNRKNLYLHGCCYIPAECIRHFNERFSTDYDAKDRRFIIDSSIFNANKNTTEDNIEELKGQLVDIVEDYLTKTYASDKDAVFIKGDDYDKLADKFGETLKNWGLI